MSVLADRSVVTTAPAVLGAADQEGAPAFTESRPQHSSLSFLRGPNLPSVESTPALPENCRAHAAALFTRMSKAGVLNRAFASKEASRKTAYADSPETAASRDENEDVGAACRQPLSLP